MESVTLATYRRLSKKNLEKGALNIVFLMTQVSRLPDTNKPYISISSDELRIKIRLFIDSEDWQPPLTDQAIAGFLEKESLSVASRTVAKYRGKLGVVGARKRRKQAGEVQQVQKRFGTD